MCECFCCLCNTQQLVNILLINLNILYSVFHIRTCVGELKLFLVDDTTFPDVTIEPALSNRKSSVKTSLWHKHDTMPLNSENTVRSHEFEKELHVYLQEPIELRTCNIYDYW